MMPGNLFCLQLAAAFHDRRQIALRIGISTLLALPFILVRMPSHVQAAGIVMVILFTSFFGTAISHAHLRADMRLARLGLLPISRAALWLDLVLSSVLMRLGPAGVVLAAFVIVKGQDVTTGASINLAGLLCGTLVLLTLLGTGVGRLARNNAEVHLFGALAAAVLASVSGITPLPERLAPLAAAMVWNPISRLLMRLTALAAGPAAVSTAELALSTIVLIALATAAVLRWTSGNCRLATADCGLTEALDANPQSEIRNLKSSLEV